jgi:hypothetical protein
MPEPYPQKETNFIYNLLFCDEPAMFAPKAGEKGVDWKEALYTSAPNKERVAALARNPAVESRVRLLAYNWLRARGAAAGPRELLGVVVEVPLEEGLDVLAAYRDGRVRYINQSCKMAIYEGSPPDVEGKVRELLAASEIAVARIGPWDKPRLPAPAAENIRMTFLVSDGLYFAEGPFSLMMREPMAAPVINRATELLQLVVKQALEVNAPNHCGRVTVFNLP